MLRRRFRPAAPGPVEGAARRRRRVLASAAGFVVVAILLLVALFMAAWLRQHPPVDPRRAPLPGAIALARIDWSDNNAAPVRAPLRALHWRNFRDDMDFETFWGSCRFLLHPSATLWLLPNAPRTTRGRDAFSSTPENGLSWIAALSLKRRHAFIARQVNRLLRRLGARVLTGEPGLEGATVPSLRGLVGGTLGGAVVIGAAEDRGAKYSGS